MVPYQRIPALLPSRGNMLMSSRGAGALVSHPLHGALGLKVAATG